MRELTSYVDGRSRRTQPEYGRMGNPTVACVEKRIAAIEGAERAQLFASGMAAITTLLLTVLKSGDHIVITSDSYKRTRDFSTDFLKKFGVRASVVFPSVDEIEKAFTTSTRLIFTETPTNPYLYVVDIEKLAKRARAKGILTVVDSTFATPLNMRPLPYGIDLVIHSGTKYLGGHNDLIAGVLAGKASLVEPVSEMLATLGGICDPTTAFLLDRGLKTLALRVKKQNESGMRVAQYLEGHPKIRTVFYPGLASHPHHAIAKRLMDGFAGVVTFLLDGTFTAAARFIDALTIPLLGPSLGGVESLVEPPVVMGYWDMAKEERQQFGMFDNLVRLSVGIEDADDIIKDLEQALKKTRAASARKTKRNRKRRK
jgi:cystathionine gamma-synthase